MPPDRLVVAITIADLLRHNGGQVSLSVHSLSTVIGMNRAAVIRALDELAVAGFILKSSTGGRTGCTTIARGPRDPFSDPNREPLNPPPTIQTNGGIQERPKPHDPISDPNTDPNTARRDLDLAEAPKNSDPVLDLPPRSSSLEIKEITYVDDAELEPMTQPVTANPQDAAKRRGPDPTKIARNAWAAADGLRARILRFDPGNRLATRRWDAETGDRLKWAHTFDLMVRNDRRGWLEISDVIRWLYPDGSADPVHAPGISRFVIHSADSLREKFDRVRAAQLRAHSAAQPRNPDGRPDTLAGRTTKPWGSDGGWGGGDGGGSGGQS